MKKKSKNKVTETIKVLLIFFVIIFIAICIILFSIKNLKSNSEEQISNVKVQEEKENEQKEIILENINKVAIDKLSKMSERDRMEYYVSNFIESVEQEQYEDAYNILYDDFKTNYFPTLDEFKTYVKKTFPKMSLVEYTNIERNGDVYILYITISNALNSKSENGKEIKFVIQENDLNDFVMSFSVI